MSLLWVQISESANMIYGDALQKEITFSLITDAKTNNPLPGMEGVQTTNLLPPHLMGNITQQYCECEKGAASHNPCYEANAMAHCMVKHGLFAINK